MFVSGIHQCISISIYMKFTTKSPPFGIHLVHFYPIIPFPFPLMINCSVFLNKVKKHDTKEGERDTLSTNGKKIGRP